MRTKFQSPKNKGFVLLFTCLGAAVVISIALASYLTVVQTQTKSIVSSQDWNSSLVIAEAGVEEGMALINKYAGTGNTLTSWPSSATTDGWTKSGNVYSLTRNIGAGSYTVYVTNVSATLSAIYSKGTYNWTNQNVAGARALLVNAATSSSYLGGVVSKNGIVLSGSAMVDSFNSLNTNYSSNGLYALSMHKAGGSIMTAASNATMTTEITMSGGTHVYGTVNTGPNDGISLSGSATIGDTNFAGPGIQSGWSNNAQNIYIPDALPVPTGVSWLSMPAMTNNTITLKGFGPGTTNYYVITSSFGNLSGSQQIVVTNGTILLDVQNNFQLSGSSAINLAPNGNLVAWFDGSSTQISGSGIVNHGNNATNVTFYGTTNLTSLQYSGSASFIGTIYAPEANIQWSGSASVIGAVTANSFQDSGGASIHFDEALLGQASASYVVSSWQEVSY